MLKHMWRYIIRTQIQMKELYSIWSSNAITKLQTNWQWPIIWLDYLGQNGSFSNKGYLWNQNRRKWIILLQSVWIYTEYTWSCVPSICIFSVSLHMKCIIKCWYKDWFPKAIKNNWRQCATLKSYLKSFILALSIA